MQHVPPGTNLALRRTNQMGVAHTELARIQFAQQISTISVTTGTPIRIVEQLAETALRTRLEEVEAMMNMMNSHHTTRYEE